MLITVSVAPLNKVYTATVTTEANSYEVALMKIYGEPKVLSGGQLSYPDPVHPIQTTVTNTAVTGVVQDAPNARTLVYVDTSQLDLSTINDHDTIVFANVTPAPLLNGTHKVVAVDEINGVVAVDVTGISTQNPFKRNVIEGTITDGAQQVNQTISGFTDGATLVLQLNPGTTLNFGVLNVGDTVVISGCTIQPALNGSRLLTAFNATQKTLTFGPAGLTSIPVFQVNNPTGDITSTPSPVPFDAPTKDVFVRSSSPMVYSLDGKSDAEAQTKVTTWATDVKNKIVAAMTALKTNPSPLAYPIVSSTEI